MTREDLLFDRVCPLCEERFVLFQDLYQHLMGHLDEGTTIAEDYLEECCLLAASEEESEY